MVWEKIKKALFGNKKRKHRNIAKGVAGSAAVAGLVATAKKMHEKGYDDKAVKMLKDSADTLKEEAGKLKQRIKQNRKPEDIKGLEKKLNRITKDEIKELAMEEYGVKLTTNDLKDEMIEQLITDLKER